MARLGQSVSVRCLLADTYEDGHKQGCAERRTRAVEDLKPGAFG
jgi:hypothetical protein